MTTQSITLKILSSQQKVITEMVILGLILSIFVAVSGAFLLVTAKDDALASISGMVSWLRVGWVLLCNVDGLVTTCGKN